MSLTKRLDEARAAYIKQDVGAAAAAHDRQRIAQSAEEQHGSEGSKYISNVVYGGLDGIITTFAVVSGVVGAQLNPGVIIIMGLANLLGDGFSMATGAYLSSKSDQEYYDREQAREIWEIDHFPEGEKQELLQIYLSQDYPVKDVQKMVEIKSADKQRWVKAMMVEELGLMKDERSPIKEALTTFTAFLVAGSVPLITYLISLIFRIQLGESTAFTLSIGLSATALFGLGAAKVLVTQRNPIRSGLEMLIVGGLAAAVAFGVGAALRSLGINAT